MRLASLAGLCCVAAAAQAATQVESCPPAPYAAVPPTTSLNIVFSTDGSDNPPTRRCLPRAQALSTWFVKVTDNGGTSWRFIPLSSLTPPPVPAPLATLTWTAPTLDVAGKPLTVPLTYNVYRGTSATALTLIKNVTGLSTTDTVPVAGLYWYALTANAVGRPESVKSPAVSALINPGSVVSPAPAPPSGLTVK